MKELLKNLSQCFGPSGYEDGVRDLIREYVSRDMPKDTEVFEDRIGNLYVHFKKTDKPVLMINAHMDEVGFMVTGITESGYLKFGCIGGMNPLVIGGKRLISERGVRGVTLTKPIHQMSDEEKKKPVPVSEMAIDIGARSYEDARKHADIGDFFVFDSEYVEYGEGYIKCKALDDRHGCAIMCKMIDAVKSGLDIEYDLWFAFTRREEISYSCARCATERIRPDLALVIESKAVQDIYGVPDEKKVCILGDGAIISFMDNATVYDRELVRHLIDICKEKGIKYQMNKYISGGNDASNIQKSIGGVKVGLISAPSRYIHSQANVVKYSDLESMLAIGVGLISSKFSYREDRI